MHFTHLLCEYENKVFFFSSSIKKTPQAQETSDSDQRYKYLREKKGHKLQHLAHQLQLAYIAFNKTSANKKEISVKVGVCFVFVCSSADPVRDSPMEVDATALSQSLPNVSVLN